MKTFGIASVISAAALVVVHVEALPSYIPRIPNGANVQGVTALGHADHVGDSEDLDAFGTAFKNAGKKWTVALCQADSDGDGQTNGEELGDPCCTWSVGGTPKFSAGVSNPGDAGSKVSASILSSNSCSTASPPAATSATPVVTPAASASPASSPTQPTAALSSTDSNATTTAAPVAHDNC